MRLRKHWVSIALLLGTAGCAPQGGSAQDPNAFPPPIAAGVLIREDERRSRLAHHARTLLHQEAFDRIEVVADSLRAAGAEWPSGAPKFISFALRGFEEVDDPARAESWELHLDALRQWNAARPASKLAPIALAEGLLGRARTARGAGLANTVSPGELGRMRSDATEALSLLRQCRAPARDHPLWYEATLHAFHSLGDDRAYRETFEEAIRRFPLHRRFYVNAGIHLMPRWYGGPGEVTEVLWRATRALPDSIADEYFSHTIADLAQYSTNVFEEHQGLEWPRVRDGLQKWQARCPRSLRARSSMALLAAMAGDWPYSWAAFEALGDTVDLEVWSTRPNFDDFRGTAWASARAQSNPGATAVPASSSTGR